MSAQPHHFHFATAIVSTRSAICDSSHSRLKQPDEVVNQADHRGKFDKRKDYAIHWIG